MEYKNFIGGKEASKKLGVHQRTLYQWEEKGHIETIRTPGGKRLYNVDKYINNIQIKNDSNISEQVEVLNEEGKLNIVYVRVSSIGQKDDLKRQKDEMVKKYPKHLLIEDIGSGINFNRKGIRKIIKLAIEGKINELVVAYKDRLTRFGYELIEDLIKEYSNGKIIILNSKEEIEPEEELAKDVLQIMNVFVAKMNGLRKYNKNH
jgi:putative resolvase